MDKNDTVIVVGVTEKDEYGNLWVTPKGGGDKVKVAAKRNQLHPLFEQGVAVMLHWETYMNKPYVSDAKLVEGELPDVKEPGEPLPEHTEEIKGAVASTYPVLEVLLWLKEMGEFIISGQLERDFPKSFVRIKSDYYKAMSRGTGIDLWGKGENE